MGKKAKALEQQLAAASAAAKKSARSLRDARRRAVCLEVYRLELTADIRRSDEENRRLRELVHDQSMRLGKLRSAAVDCHLHLLTMTKNTDGAVRNYIGDACNMLGRVLGKELSPYGWKPEDEAYTRAEVLRIVR